MNVTEPSFLQTHHYFISAEEKEAYPSSEVGQWQGGRGSDDPSQSTLEGLSVGQPKDFLRIHQNPHQISHLPIVSKRLLHWYSQ